MASRNAAIKLVNAENGNIHRVRLSGDMDALLVLCRKTLKLSSDGSLDLSYIDDEDENIVLSSSDELDEAFAALPQGKTLKIWVQFHPAHPQPKAQAPEKKKAPVAALVLKPAKEVKEDAAPKETAATDSVPTPVVPTESKQAEPEQQEQALVKCARESCNFLKHSNPKNNDTHCCKACRSDGRHGPACEKRVVPGTEEKTTPFPSKPELLGFLQAAAGDAAILKELETAIAKVKDLLQDGIVDPVAVIDVVLRACPLLAKSDLVVRVLLPHLPLIISQAQKVMEWSPDLVNDYLDVLDYFLTSKTEVAHGLDLASVYDLVEAALQTGAKIEPDLIVVPPQAKKKDPTATHCALGHELVPNEIPRTGFGCDDCDKGIEKGTIAMSCRRCDYDRCDSCQANLVQDHTKADAKEEAAAPVPKAPVHRDVECDICGAHPIVGKRYKCSVCPNFDLCEACELKDLHPRDHVMMVVKEPREMAYRPLAARRARAAAGEALRATFIADKTMPDMCHVLPGVSLVKVWSLKNTGKVKWPAGSGLCFISGEVEPTGGRDSTVPVPLADPGQIVDVSVPVKIPHVPGRRVGNFRLQSGNGQKFGVRIWTTVNVLPEKDTVPSAAKAKVEAPQASAPAAEDKANPLVAALDKAAAAQAAGVAQEPEEDKVPADFKYRQQLLQLRGMGFQDDEMSMYLLLNNGGNVQRVVAWLLTNQ